MVKQTPSLPLPGLDFSEAEVRKAISSFPAGSSGGPSGLRPAHLKQLLQSPKAKELVSAVAQFCLILASGHLPEGAREVICSARLFASGKDNKKIRPIAVGDVLRRLTGKLLLHTFGDTASELLAPQQLGIAVSGGMEGLIHAVRGWYQSHPKDECLLKIDFRNAFNCVHRQLVLTL